MIAEVYDPGLAVTAGFLDRVVSTTELSGTARDVAGQLRALDLDAHLATKLRARGKALAAVREAIRPGLR